VRSPSIPTIEDYHARVAFAQLFGLCADMLYEALEAESGTTSGRAGTVHGSAHAWRKAIPVIKGVQD